MSREVHVRFCERREVRSLLATHLVVCVAGHREHAETLVKEVEQVIAPLGLKLSREKTRVVSIDEGYDFRGVRIQRKRKRGSSKVFVYSWPSQKALASITAKIKTITRQGTDQPLSDLLRQINAALRGWTVYFRHGCAKQTFDYLGRYMCLRSRLAATQAPPRHLGVDPTALPRHPGRAGAGALALFNPGSVPVTRYRYRGAKIPNPRTERTTTTRTTG